jgi:hypothetical protein
MNKLVIGLLTVECVVTMMVNLMNFLKFFYCEFMEIEDGAG